MRKLIAGALVIIAILAVAIAALSARAAPAHVDYGVTFSPLYARELGLDWRAAYRATLSDLDVKKLRLAAYWPQIEPQQGKFDWTDLDYEIAQARAHGATVILAVGRRLPRWPECHVPDWAQARSWEEQKPAILAQVRAVVERYKGDPTIVMWQVENEPFLLGFAESTCGDLDADFFRDELALVRSLDSRPIMVTDGGNFGTWVSAYRAGDVFGTSVYLYFWTETTGLFRTVWPPAYYRAKSSLMRLFGAKPIILSELSLEPWFGVAVDAVPVEEQLQRMNMDTFDEIVAYARRAGFDTQYLWGVEWWYYMKDRGHPEFWSAAKKLFSAE